MDEAAVTGGAGFIGIRPALSTHVDDAVINRDKLTYAGSPNSLADFKTTRATPLAPRHLRCENRARRRARVDAIVNFAARTHVDRSLMEPEEFLRTDVFGIFTRLEAVRELGVARFVHINTDEVYGRVGDRLVARDGSPAAEPPLLGFSRSPTERRTRRRSSSPGRQTASAPTSIPRKSFRCS